MNLAKLFETQKVLRDRIDYNEADRYKKLVLALLVETGECANEHRGFKFWSKDQSPRLTKSRAPYMDLDDADFYNPLLEEYVDKLHFILETGIELTVDRYIHLWGATIPRRYSDVTTQFLHFYVQATELYKSPSRAAWHKVFSIFIGLGEMLGFTWEQIEQAYFEKNKVNHARQESGY